MGDSYDLQYVDNLGVFGKDRRGVNSIKDVGRELMNRARLVMHDKTVELLGHVIHPSLPAIRLNASRARKFGAVVKHILRRRKVSGRAVEIIVGHLTYVFLLNRCLLFHFQRLTSLSVVHALNLKSFGPVSAVS